MSSLPVSPSGPCPGVDAPRSRGSALRRYGVAFAAVLTLGLMALPGARVAVTAAQDYSQMGNIEIGLHVSPVPMNLKGKNRNLVGLGSYFVNVQSSCNDCHTNPPFAPGGNPYLGEPKVINTAHFLGGGQHYDPFISANITPDANGLPAGLAASEFVATIRTGHTDRHPGLGPLLQIMPWPYFQDMTDQDLSAVYEYLRSIPHAEPGS